MNLLVLSWKYIREKPLNSFLNTFLLSLGISIIVVLLLVSSQLRDNLENNAKGIDLVVGAKGSPLQLILSSIYHIDYPTGNISLEEARKIAGNRRHVKSAIPMALGDSYREFRIVGTNHQYLNIYEATFEKGREWQGDFEVVLGTNVAATLGFDIGDHFSGEHGLTSGGQSHDHHHYEVVGVLEKSNSVLDNLILSNVESVWLMHEKEGEHDEQPEDHELEEDIFGIQTEEDITGKELTSILIQYRGPRAALQFPRMVNGQGALQAASPPFETARLFSIVGVGFNVLEWFAYLIIFIAGLSVFIGLYNSMKERKYELAVMRTLGASPGKLFVMILIEGLIITFIGGLMGFILGHGVVEVLGQMMASSNQSLVTGQLLLRQEYLVVIYSLLLGIFASIIPAFQAYRTDISQVLDKA